MRKMIICAFATMACMSIQAQELELGLRDNQFVRADYIGSIARSEYHHYVAGFEQSLLNVKMKEQSGRLFAGYMYKDQTLEASGIVYGGSEYTGNWQVAGALLKGHYTWKRLGIGTAVNPHYDTKLGFQFNYDVEASVAVWAKTFEQFGKQQLDVCASFGNMPEYRDNIQNLRVGLKFTSGNLWVQPEISVPEIGDKDKTSDKIRVLCSLGLRMKIKKARLCL